MRERGRATPVDVVLGAILAIGGLAGCSSRADGEVRAGASTASSPTPAPASRGGGSRDVSPDGWSAAGLQGVPYVEESCRVRWAIFDGLRQPLPDPRCTPGAIDPQVTQADIGQTICRYGGFTSSVRPPESISEPAKYTAIRAYGSYDGTYAKPYEFDHLIPLELGGSSSTYNLWPEQDVGLTGPYLANTKDQVEDDLHAAVCAGRVTLVAAQKAIASNWTTAEQVLGVVFGSG